MQLKHRGTKIQVFLHKPELSKLAKARELLEQIALLPCDQQEGAGEIAAAIDGLAQSMTRGKPGVLDGQQELPFPKDEPEEGADEDDE